MAIKLIGPDLANDPTFIRRFQAEAQAIATLEHPHIVPLYDYWREPDAAYLVMRLMRGGNLASVLERGPLSSAQTMTMLDQLGNALQTAHRSGVVHGDINSDNVLFDDEGNAYLSDFGIAVGVGDVDVTLDIAGLGVLVAQALSGRTGEVDELRHALPGPIARIIDRATDGDSIGTLRERRRLGRRSARGARPGTWDRRLRGSSRRRPSTTRTRGCARSMPSTRSTSSVANDSSNG